MRHALSLAALALALPACTGTGLYGGDDAPPSAAAAARPESPGDYVAMAGASDLFEIESSRLALERAQDPKVQEFARMMIEQHTDTTQKVTAAARGAGIVPDQPQLMPVQQQMMTELRAAGSGSGFERTYLAQQRRAHDMALALHEGYAKDGQSPELRAVAGAAVPIIKEHIRRLRMMP